MFLWPLAVHPSRIAARPNDMASDLLLTHLPNARYIRASVREYGRIPLWNAQILAGQPFAADPLSGMMYPPNILLYLLPLPFAFNLLIFLHSVWMGRGMLALLRAEDVPSGPAFFGSLLFMATPKLMAHLGAGHITLFYAVAWVPWALVLACQVAQHGRRRSAAQLGAVLALSFLATPQWGPYTFALGFTYCVWRWAGWRRTGTGSAPWSAVGQGLLWAAGFALALSAVMLLPLTEFEALSGRKGLSLEEAGIYSLPAHPYLLGAVIPFYGVVHEFVTYVGIVAVGLAVLGAFRRTWFWLTSLAFSLFFSLGVNAPLYPLLFRVIPGLGSLRVPSRAWLIVSLCIAALAAYGLAALQAALGAAAAQTRRRRWMPGVVLPALCGVALGEMLLMSASQLTTRPWPDPPAATQWLARQDGMFRVFSPSGSLPMPDDLQHVEGVSPIHLASIRDYVAQASRIAASGYSVSVPAQWIVLGETPAWVTRRASAPDAEMLGLLNVGFVASEFPLDSAGLELAQIAGSTYIYRNLMLQPRAWAQSGTARIRYWSPDRIQLEASGPGRLTLSEVYYPGWKAKVDGLPVAIEATEGLLRSVVLGPGSHQVEFEFRPPSVSLGLAITAGGLLGLLAIHWSERSHATTKGAPDGAVRQVDPSAVP